MAGRVPFTPSFVYAPEGSGGPALGINYLLLFLLPPAIDAAWLMNKCFTDGLDSSYFFPRCPALAS
jgi:hypothetical protein